MQLGRFPRFPTCEAKRFPLYAVGRRRRPSEVAVSCDDDRDNDDDAKLGWRSEPPFERGPTRSAEETVFMHQVARVLEVLRNRHMAETTQRDRSSHN